MSTPVACLSHTFKEGDTVAYKPWSYAARMAGTVVSTNLPRPYKGQVAVYFCRRVSIHSLSYFASVRQTEVEEWDSHSAIGLPRVLYSNFRLIMRCPRVLFFNTDDLVEKSRWTLEHRTLVTFGSSNWHGVFHVKGGIPAPGTRPCLIKSCRRLSSELALINVQGSVFPVPVCPHCFHKYNGILADDLPDLKKQ